jgi:hypothetical protein
MDRPTPRTNALTAKNAKAAKRKGKVRNFRSIIACLILIQSDTPTHGQNCQALNTNLFNSIHTRQLALGGYRLTIRPLPLSRLSFFSRFMDRPAPKMNIRTAKNAKAAKNKTGVFRSISTWCPRLLGDDPVDIRILVASAPEIADDRGQQTFIVCTYRSLFSLLTDFSSCCFDLRSLIRSGTTSFFGP